MMEDLSRLMKDVIERLPVGRFNKSLSSKTKLRYGTKGSLVIDISKGTFYDHEANEGGGVLDLIKRCNIGDPIGWLQSQGLIAADPELKTFDYLDEDENLVFQVCRGPGKTFRQRRPNGKGWIWDLKGVRRIPYHLPELLKDAGTVFIPEGEKHVDALRAIGLRATCNPMGAGKWRDEYSEFLRNEDVVILPDNDEAGLKHAETIALSLRGIAARTRILNLPGLPEKGDVIDWLGAGGTKQKLLALAHSTPDWQQRTSLDGLVKNTSDLRTTKFEPLKFIVPRYFAEGLTLLVGKPKIRKSWLILDMSICVALGTKFLGERCEQGDVLYLSLEDSDRRMKGRMEIMLGSASKWPGAMSHATEWPAFDEGGLDLIEEWIARKKNPRLVSIDVLQRVRPRVRGRENAYALDYNALKQLHGLAAKHRIGVVVVHHQRKAAADDKFDTISGTQGLQAAADAALVLEKSENRRKLSGTGRDFPEFEIIIEQDDRMRWHLVGDAYDVLMSEERKTILDAIRKSKRGMKIGEVATAVGKDYNTVKQRLWKMCEQDDLVRENGLYKLATEQRDFEDVI